MNRTDRPFGLGTREIVAYLLVGSSTYTIARFVGSLKIRGSVSVLQNLQVILS